MVSSMSLSGPVSKLRLPAELNDYIIDHLWNDPASLRSCSLTCHGWLPATRYHLFYRIRIRSSSECLRFRKFLEAPTPLPHSHLSYYVRELVFQDLPLRGLDIRRLGRTFSKLRKVEYLELCFWPLEDLPEDLVKELFSVFTNVKALRLEEVEFKNPLHLYQLITALPKLHQFASGDPQALGSGKVPHAPYEITDSERGTAPDSSLGGVKDKNENGCRDLTLLILDHALYAPSLVSWLLKGPFRLCLRELRVVWRLGDEHYDLLEQLFHAVTTPLQVLSLAFQWPKTASAVDSITRGITRLRVEELEVLEIGPIIILPTDDSLENSVAWMTCLLSHVHANATRLHKVRFDIKIDSELHELHDLDLERLDNALLLLSRKFPGLRVTFDISTRRSSILRNRPSTGTVDHAIVDRLPQLRDACKEVVRQLCLAQFHSKCILRVSFVAKSRGKEKEKRKKKRRKLTHGDGR